MCPPTVTTPIVTFWLQWQNHEVPNGLPYNKYAWLQWHLPTVTLWPSPNSVTVGGHICTWMLSLLIYNLEVRWVWHIVYIDVTELIFDSMWFPRPPAASEAIFRTAIEVVQVANLKMHPGSSRLAKWFRCQTLLQEVPGRNPIYVATSDYIQMKN